VLELGGRDEFAVAGDVAEDDESVLDRHGTGSCGHRLARMASGFRNATTVDRSYVARHNAERARLRVLISRASDGDLSRAMPAGWTVAGVLALMAFWDQRISVLLDRWQHEGASPPLENPVDVPWINDAAKPLMLALPPRRAAELALAIAEAVDRQVETLSDDVVARNAAAGLLNLARADHRSEHLDDLERVLGKTRP